MPQPDPDRFRVEFAPSVERDLRRLPSSMATRLIERIEQLADDPQPFGVRKLVGADRTYRVRVGDYRIVYDVDFRERVVTVQRVRHRSDAYR